MDIPIKKYTLKQEGLVYFMDFVAPAFVTLELTCIKCKNVKTCSVNWQGGRDRFKVNTSCGGDGCNQLLVIWEIPRRSVDASPLIAVQGEFTINDRIVDSKIKWSGDFYDHVLKFETTGDGNGSIRKVEKRFNQLIKDELKKIEDEYMVGNYTDDLEIDHSFGISSEEDVLDDDDDDDDGEVPKKNWWKNMKYNYISENREEILHQQMLERAERKEKMKLRMKARRALGLKKKKEVKNRRPCADGLCLLVINES